MRMLAWSVLVLLAVGCSRANSQSPPPTRPSEDAGARYARERVVLHGVEVRDSRLSRVRPRDEPDGTKDIVGQIENRGDRTLRAVKLTVYYLDDSGKRIDERTGYVVHPDPLPMHWGASSEPVRPGYRRDFSRYISKPGKEGAPSGWAGGVEWAVTDVEFAE